MRRYSFLHVFFFLLFTISSCLRVGPYIASVSAWTAEWAFYIDFLVVWLLLGRFVFIPLFLWLSRRLGFHDFE